MTDSGTGHVRLWDCIDRQGSHFGPNATLCLDINRWQIRIESGILVILFSVVAVATLRTTRIKYIIVLSIVFLLSNSLSFATSFTK